MNHRILGKTNFKISEIGLGCWQLGNDFGPLSEETAETILNTARDKGITFLDTADVYGGGLSEERIGKWLKNQDVKPVIATKVGRNGELYPDGYTKENLKKSITGSLKRLGVETLDLVQLHCIPREVLYAGEVLGWMEDLQAQGLFRNFGASVEMIEEAQFCLGNTKVATLQIIFNMFRQDAAEKVLPLAQEKGVGIIVRLPLASGLLSGKMTKKQSFDPGDHRNYNRDGQYFHVGETFNGIPFEKAVDLVEGVKPLLPEEKPMATTALRWILDHPVTTVIAGTTKVPQVIANAESSDIAPLSKETHQKVKSYYFQEVRDHIRGGI